MPNYETHCSACEHEAIEMIKMADVDAWDAAEKPCPLCGAIGTYKREWRTPPMTRVGGEGSNRQIHDMRQSFDKRFWKKDSDDVRHKFGEVFDDSMRGAAVDRIKSKVKP